MTEDARSSSVSKLFQELDRRLPLSWPIDPDQELILSWTKEFVQAIEKLRNYRTFLRSARAYKGTAERAPAELEREVLNHARYAMSEANIFVARALTTVRHLKATGVLDRVFGTIHESLMKTGPVSLSEVRRELAGQLRFSPSLLEAGVSDDLVKQCMAEIPEVDRIIESRRGGVLVVTDSRGAGFTITKRSGIQASRGVQELLFGNRFDAVVDRLERTGIMRASYAPASLTGKEKRHCGVDELVLLAAGRFHARMNHHVRQLEQIGIARYSGEAPGVAIFLAGLAATVVGAGGMLVCCPIGNTDCCIGAILLFIVGVLMMVFVVEVAAAEGDPLFGSDPAVGIETHGNPGSPEPSL